MDARVVALAEFETERWVGYRVEQSGREGPVVGSDIAVVQGNRFDVLQREYITETEPDIPPFTFVFWRQTFRGELAVQVAQPLAVVPQDVRALRQSAE